MRILVLGGTQFVGRHLVAAALSRGHEVTLFHRGAGADPLFPEAEHRHGDRNGDLAALSAGAWDATLDVTAYVPRQVRSLAAALDGRGGHHTFISSVSAYVDPTGPGATEGAPLRTIVDPLTEEVTAATYGGLKALCEAEVIAAYGAGALLIRPTYVIGPQDVTGRYTWWVRRLARGGEVLVPGPATAPVQVVDARDLADWTLGLLEAGTAGALHAALPAPPYSLGDLLAATAAAVAPPGTTLTWAEPDFLLTRGVDGRALPLWSRGEPAWASAVDPTAALASGLSLRPLAETARAVLADAATVVPPGVGLDPGRETELLAALTR